VALASVEGRRPLPSAGTAPRCCLARAGTFNDVGSPHEEEGDVAEDKQLDRTKFLGVAATGVAAAGSLGIAGYTGSTESEGS
jgi:hypothetical protein